MDSQHSLYSPPITSLPLVSCIVLYIYNLLMRLNYLILFMLCGVSYQRNYHFGKILANSALIINYVIIVTVFWSNEKGAQ